MKYAVIIEKGNNSYGAYVPDLPGCVAVGETAAEADLRTTIQNYLDMMLYGYNF